MTLVTPPRSSSETWRISVPRSGKSIGRPHIAPDIVVLVDGDVVGLICGIRERNNRGLHRLCVDAGKRRAPRITDPQHVGVLVGAHAPRALRPWQRVAVGELIKAVIERLGRRRKAGDLIL